MSKKTDRQNEFIAQARTHVGYKTKTGTESYYGGLVGYQGLSWNGAFVDVVARETGLFIPACVNTTSGLAEFIRLRRWHGRPQIGDIVFYAFPTATDYVGQGHIGIVTEVTDWQKLGRIKAIEGMTDSGLPRQNIKSYDGVYERTRYKADILGFGRPNFQVRPAREHNKADGRPQVRISKLKPGTRARDIELVQLALAAKTGVRNVARGSWDGHTTAAYAQWQRSIGYAGPDATGIPDEPSLSRLARETGMFELRA